MTEKSIQIEPRKSFHFWWYVVGILLTPLLIGIYILYKKNRELSNTHYKITDQTIILVNPTYTEAVDIINIHDVKVHQRWIDKKFNIGTLRLVTHTKQVELAGIENPANLADMILQAAEMERARIRELERKDPAPKEMSPGTLDKLDYLTGLWQQGLISNDDFEREKKHFEDK